MLKISTFDINVTPPIGSCLAYDKVVATWDMSLRAKGLVLTGAGDPIVLCAFDWIGIANESQDVFKKTLADAVHTDPARVAVHTLHQHDAPRCDFSVEKELKKLGKAPEQYDGSFARELLPRLAKAAADSLNGLRPISHLSIGKAPVFEVASNRRIIKNGKALNMRASSCKDPLLVNEPEGLIDPDVTLLGFWDGENPVAVMTFYATHPQSYYRTGIPNPDFPGIARFNRQMAIPDALHIHFNGASGNIAAGKYNDGAPEKRMILARRLADGMTRAWKNSTKMPLTDSEVSWKTESIKLPVSEKLLQQMKSKDALPNSVALWAKRTLAGKTTDAACLTLGKAKVLFMPGELFVEYQLAAKAFRPDLAVSMAAYGEYGPSYVGTKEAYNQGGYEIESSPVNGEAEAILMNTIQKLLN